MLNDRKSLRVWDASECVLAFIDYQEHVFDVIFAQDRRVIELNVRTLAKMAAAFKIPVILSTVGVELGANGPTIDSLRAVVPNVRDIDRSTMNAWADSKFQAAVKATGRKRLVMCGISTSACLTYPVVSALADGYEHSLKTPSATVRSGSMTRRSSDLLRPGRFRIQQSV
jgi:nicotinamidase-related amidase